MKNSIYLFFLTAITLSCTSNHQVIENKNFVDSLTHHFSIPKSVEIQEKDLAFWKNRIDPKFPGQVSESRYAGSLIGRFHEFGNIRDIDTAEKILKGINIHYNNSLASPYSALVSTSILRHRFSLADTFLQKAIHLGIGGFTRNTLSFDVDFETGKFSAAQFYLSQLRGHKDYAYYFRKSKWEHFNGNIDSAISSMNRAADLEKDIPYLKGIALSNTADLYVHQGEMEKAGELYRNCIRLNSLDLHSILGLSWVLLEKDQNDSLALTLMNLGRKINALPDPLFRLYQYGQATQDTNLEKKYALEFEKMATDTLYGKMYNKYLIEMYTGILHRPDKAEILAKNELSNRAIPTTYAWYAYSLLRNHKPEQAYSLFKKYISGKPLESLELYYMGCLFQELNKGFNAHEFFKAADKNRFDLSPSFQRNLRKFLEE